MGEVFCSVVCFQYLGMSDTYLLTKGYVWSGMITKFSVPVLSIPMLILLLVHYTVVL